MKIKLLILLLASGLMLNISGCSSSDDDTKDAQAADAQDPALDSEGVEAAKDMDKPADADAKSDAKSDDFAKDEEVIADSGDDVKDSGTLPDKSLDEKAADDKTSDDLLADDNVSETPAPDAKSDTTKEEGVFDSTTASDAPPADIDTASQSPELTAAAGALADSNTAPTDAPKPVASLKKIKDAPFKQGKQLLNTVYVARQGDTTASISQKIYGSDKSKDLKKANPFLKNRDAKIGDKIYYNSPKRPTDSEKMLTYYEDSGIPAQTYVAKAGDNIHGVSKNLLGDKNSWKEVWATNLAVESKGDLSEGTELRYWPADTSAPAPAPEVAAATPPPAAPEPTQAANKPKDDFALPDDMAKNQQPNPAAPAAGTVAVEPPPPPPPPPAAPIQKTVASKDMGMNKDLTFMLSAGGLLLVGVGVLLGIIRKSRSRKMNMNTHTQI